MQWAKQKQAGFTIVELLIVVVVIAILAAITIVSYNGITTRAENTKTNQAAAQAVKSLLAYAAQNGNYPTTSGYTCIGSAVCGNMTDNSGACFSVAQVASNASLDTALRTVSSIPSPSAKTSGCGGKEYGGMFFQSSNRVFVWFLTGDSACDVGGLENYGRGLNGSTTRCMGYLPAAV